MTTEALEDHVMSLRKATATKSTTDRRRNRKNPTVNRHRLKPLQNDQHQKNPRRNQNRKLSK